MATREHGLFRKYETPPADCAKGGGYIYYGTGPGVDTGVLIDFEGTLCLSLVEIKELAEVAGFSLDEEALQNERDIAFLAAENERLHQQNQELQGIIEGFAKAIAKDGAV